MSNGDFAKHGLLVDEWQGLPMLAPKLYRRGSMKSKSIPQLFELLCIAETKQRQGQLKPVSLLRIHRGLLNFTKAS